MRDIYECMKILRSELVVPFLKTTEQAKNILRFDEYDNLWMCGLVEDNFFPLGIKAGDHDLIKSLDSFYYLAYKGNDKFMKLFDKAMTEKHMLDSEASLEDAVVPFALNRIACSEYLLMIAKDAFRAKIKYEEDENPYTLRIAIMSLETYMHGYIRNIISECVRDLFLSKVYEAQKAASCG